MYQAGQVLQGVITDNATASPKIARNSPVAAEPPLLAALSSLEAVIENALASAQRLDEKLAVVSVWFDPLREGGVSAEATASSEVTQRVREATDCVLKLQSQLDRTFAALEV